MGNQTKKDFSRFDAMSTEELNMFLRGYLGTPESEESSVDMDAVLYAMEVVAKREQETHPEDFPNVEDAWRDFMENYYPRVEAEMSEKNESKTIQINTHDNTPAQKPRGRWRSMSTWMRVASIAIMVLVLFAAGTGVAYAAGYDVFGAVATWTSETFTFRGRSGNLSMPPESESEYSSLQEALDAYNISIPLAPRWIPKDYSLQQLDVSQFDNELGFFVTYTSGEDLWISFSAIKCSDADFSIVEKTDADVEKFFDGGIDHYIMYNTGCMQAIWLNEDFECMIAGNGISSKQLELIINSIYKEW